MPNVLMIDAEKDFSTPLVSAMQSWGYGVTWTPDGKEGLDRATADRPNAIILCVELGKMSGYSICNKLKKDDQLKDIPLIITSREATNETFEQHKKLKTRAESYLIKPFKPQELQQVLQQLVPSGALPVGELKAHDLGQRDEDDIVLDDFSGAKEEAFDPGVLVGAESKEQDPMDALDGFQIAADEDPDGDGATRVMSVSPAQMQELAKAAERQRQAEAKRSAQETAAAAAKAAAVAKPAPVAAAAAPRAQTASSQKALTDDERRTYETKLQEAKTKAAQSAQDVDRLRAEMNQLRTKSREEAAALRAQIQELTDKFKQEQQALKQRYEDTTQKAVAEATQLRQQIKDVQGRAQSEIESLRSQLIEIRNQSQDLLTNKDTEFVALKKRATELEAATEQLRAENARNEKIRERTVKAVDVALQVLQEDDSAAA